VSAPTSGTASAEGARQAPAGDEGAALPGTCSEKWDVEDLVAAGGRVIVVCGTDVRRERLAESADLARAIGAALDPARERVCACAAHMRPPPFVDLVLTVWPTDGRVRVESSDPVDEQDPAVGAPFLACVGATTSRASMPRLDVCNGPGEASLVYPVRVELAPAVR
jgi:hypothetical protein